MGSIIRVVAAAIVDTEGRWLLADRPPGRHLAGLFEFPGGKVEPGESDQTALVRELEEELGITCEIGSLLSELTHHYPERSVHLLLYRAQIARGRPTPREGQRLEWATTLQMRVLPMPPADGPFIDALEALASPSKSAFDDRVTGK
ncbi:MAG: (deoxy)nucleoside triphosphate pyrophosphohydrolase [Myxococcota bacterium]